MIRQLCIRCLDFIVPLQCAGCDTPVRFAAVWCDACASQLVSLAGTALTTERTNYPLIAAHAYAGPVQHAIHRFKFGNRPDLAHRLGRDVARALKPMVPAAGTLLVPVPLTAHRLVERGYNQAALLSGCIARCLGLKHLPCALNRRHDARHQVGASKAERAEQVSGVFFADSRSTHNKNVILVDDVITTGATSNACANALQEAGARVVAVAAVARVI